MINKIKAKSEFTKNVLTLMTGMTIAQAISIAASPILTRLYTPEDFGVYALFISITYILGSVAAGRYELAIMLPKKDEDAINVLALGFIIATFFSLLLFLIILIFHDYLTKILNNKEISLWLYFIPISVFLLGAFNLLSYFNSRKKYYKDLTKAMVLKTICAAIIQLSLGFLKVGVVGLISGYIISLIILNIKPFYNIRKLLGFINKLKIIILGKKFKDFFFFNTPSTVADSLTSQLPYIFIPKLYTLSIAGLYFFADKVIFIPARLVSNNVEKVFLQEISHRYHKKQSIMPIFKRTFFKLFGISLIISFLLFVLSPHIFSLIFGKTWEKAGYIAQMLSIIFFIRYIVSPLSGVFTLRPFVRLGSYWRFLYLFTTLLLFYVTYLLKINFWSFMYIYIFHEGILYTIYLLLIIYSINKYENSIRRGE